MEGICKGQAMGAFFLNLEPFIEDTLPLARDLKDLVAFTMAKYVTVMLQLVYLTSAYNFKLN